MYLALLGALALVVYGIIPTFQVHPPLPPLPPLPAPPLCPAAAPLPHHNSSNLHAPQPTASFGRVYAAYGGFFILLSYAWAWAVDHEVPDRMDCVGTAIALVGVLIAFFWPR